MRGQAENAGRETLADISFHVIRFTFNDSDTVLTFGCRVPVVRDHRIEEGDQFCGACLRLDDVLLHRLERGTGEHLHNWAINHVAFLLQVEKTGRKYTCCCHRSVVIVS